MYEKGRRKYTPHHCQEIPYQHPHTTFIICHEIKICIDLSF